MLNLKNVLVLLTVLMFVSAPVSGLGYESRVVQDAINLGIVVSSPYATGFQGQNMEPYSVNDGSDEIINNAEYEVNTGGRGVYTGTSATVFLKWPKDWGKGSPMCAYRGADKSDYKPKVNCNPERTLGEDGNFYTRSFQFKTNGYFDIIFNEVSDGWEFQRMSYRIKVTGIGGVDAPLEGQTVVGPKYTMNIIDEDKNIVTGMVRDKQPVRFQIPQYTGVVRWVYNTETIMGNPTTQWTQLRADGQKQITAYDDKEPPTVLATTLITFEQKTSRPWLKWVVIGVIVLVMFILAALLIAKGLKNKNKAHTG